MSWAFRLFAGAITAFGVTFCSGCDAQSRRQRTPSTDHLKSQDTPHRGPKFDRQAPGRASQVPALEGIAGRLRYEPGCLLLAIGSSDKIGLVVPAEVTFDGRLMIGTLPTPEGKLIVREIGQLVSVRGSLIENPDGRYSCKTKRLLIADQF